MFRNVIRKTVRTLKWGTVIGVSGGTLAVLAHNDWNIRSIGAIRFGRAAVTAAYIVADYKWSLRGLPYGTEEYFALKSEIHKRSAEYLREMCCKNGGVFIKVGQHLGALEYLVPKEYVETMRVLHKDAPQSPLKDIQQVIEEDFGMKVHELFTDFTETPIGAASLAQVHKATLKDGTPVAVKVQHPKVKDHAVVDMATMELLVNIVAPLFPEFKLRWLVDETKRNLPIELDFYNEGKNCERVARMFSHFDFLKVPSVYWDLTTKRVLTMEYCEGGQVTDAQYYKDHDISVDEVVRALGKLYSEMIFVQGYVHCDPHPGNVLVNKTARGCEVVLLDHGLYATLTDEFRLNYCSLWQCLISADEEGIQTYAGKLGISSLFRLFACMVTARSWKAVTKGIDKEKFTQAEDDEIKNDVANYIPEISDILNSVSREILLILKTNDLLRGIEHSLSARANARSFITMSKCCVVANYQNQRKLCNTWWCRARLVFHEQLTLFKISLYEFYLWMRS